MTVPLSIVPPRSERGRPGLRLVGLWRALASPEAAWLFKRRGAPPSATPLAAYPVCGCDIVAAPFAPKSVGEAATGPAAPAARVRRADSSGPAGARPGKAP